MAIYTSKTRIDLEDVGYSNKITNNAILKILENAGARQSETIHFGLNDKENVLSAIRQTVKQLQEIDNIKKAKK